MNQLINISKIDYFLGSTLDESMMGESQPEEIMSKKAAVSKTRKSKIRVGSGNTQLHHKKGLLRNSKNTDEASQDTSINARMASKGKNRTRYDSKSPFPQNNVRNRRGKQMAKDEKSTDADEDSKTWGLMGRGIDKRNSTKATNNTNSENGDSPWIGAKANLSSNEKNKKGTKVSKRGQSMLSKKQKPKEPLSSKNAHKKSK